MSRCIDKGYGTKRRPLSPTDQAIGAGRKCIVTFALFAPVKGSISISKADRNATLHLFTVPVCPCPGECIYERGLAVIDMTYDTYIDTGNCHIMQIKSNLLTRYEIWNTNTPLLELTTIFDSCTRIYNETSIRKSVLV
jgi:hypothetical protein